MTDYSPLVEFFEKSIPLIEKAWRGSYDKGYKARTDGLPRMTHTRRGGNRGMWFKGWDDANQNLHKM